MATLDPITVAVITLVIGSALVYFLLGANKRASGSSVPSTRAASLGANDAFRDAASLPEYTAADVAAHCTGGDAWIIVRGFVYNISPYVELHPGGDVILRNAGGDATKGFEGPQRECTISSPVRFSWWNPHFLLPPRRTRPTPDPSHVQTTVRELNRDARV